MLFFNKSQPAPMCLQNEKAKARGDYKCGNVLTRLKNDFKNKCYICEAKEPISINVEHFKPHKGNENLKFDWDNLFWSCAHCNNIKLDKFDNILDCTNVNEDIEGKLKCKLKPFPFEKVQIDVLDNSVETKNTQELLLKVYNGTTQLKSIESANLRDLILKEIRLFQGVLVDYFNDENDDDFKEYLLMKIKAHLNSASTFTSFKRSIVRDNQVLLDEFEDYFV